MNMMTTPAGNHLLELMRSDKGTNLCDVYISNKLCVV